MANMSARVSPREVEKFMKKFDRAVRRAAKKGEYEVTLMRAHDMSAEHFEQYRKRLRDLGYMVMLDFSGMLLTVSWA